MTKSTLDGAGWAAGGKGGSRAGGSREGSRLLTTRPSGHALGSMATTSVSDENKIRTFSSRPFVMMPKATPPLCQPGEEEGEDGRLDVVKRLFKPYKVSWMSHLGDNVSHRN